MSNLLTELAKAKAAFQQRAILSAMGITPEQINSNPSNSTPLEFCQHCQEQHKDGAVFCDICGDHHETDNVPHSCQTGDGV